MEAEKPSLNLPSLSNTELNALALDAINSEDDLLQREIVQEMRQRDVKLDKAFSLLEQVKENPTEPITIDHTINALFFKYAKEKVYHGSSVTIANATI